MAYEIPEKLKALVPYDPVTETYPVRLDANESFLSLPEELRQELAQAVAGLEFNRYPAPYATELCEKAGRYYDVDPKAMTAGCGSDELIGLIVSSFLEAGDTMLVALPDFSMYSFYAQLNGVKVVDACQVCGGGAEKMLFSLSAPQLIEAAKQTGAKLLIFSNPCNPTSLKLSASEVEAVIEALPDVLIVVDEAYMEFTEGSVLTKAASWDHVIVLKTCSKAFGMAAIRLGFAVAGPAITRALQAVKSPYNVNSLTQAAGCVLFDHPDYLQACTAQIKASREQLYAGILQLQQEKKEILAVLPTETNFVFFKAERPGEVFEALKKKGISIRHMKAFLRISAGSREENEAVLAALAEVLH